MAACDYDLCVVGGGINGAGIARDAAGRGLKVLLLEQGDLGQATSSASTKLIHGGLRYLEYGEFRLVREALREREILLSIAPHIVCPMAFVLPHDPSMRPAWMIRAGLFLYDHLAGRRSLAPSRAVALDKDPAGRPLSPIYDTAFVYSDAWVDDARLVVLNAVDAAARGADVLTRSPCLNARPLEDGRGWRVSFEPGGQERTARVLVNATGPWVRIFLERMGLVRPFHPRIRLVQGSHIVVPRFFEGESAYILQQPDRRVVFAIPYLDRFTLVGTTEEAFSADPSEARISPKEIAYLCRAVERSFCVDMPEDQVAWHFSGVRPLAEEDAGKTATAASRDYRLVEQREGGGALLLSVFGGKITTYRALAQEAVDRITGNRAHWTRDIALPGGDPGAEGFAAFEKHQSARYPWLDPALCGRLARAYGTRMDRILAGKESRNAMGPQIAPGLFAAEIRYMRDVEFARTAEDVLWRRSKLGLVLPQGSAAAVQAVLDEERS